MKRLVRLLVLFVTWLAWLTNVRLPDGRFAWLLAILKGFSGPLTPFLAAAGVLGAVWGLIRRDRLALFAGAAGAFFASSYIQKVTAHHEEFAFTFGPAWEQRLPSHLRWQMRSRRYALQPLSRPPAGPVMIDAVIGTHHETGAPLLADIWQPADDVPRTGIGIIYLHGSGWHYLDKNFQGSTRPFFEYLANQGYVIADVAYTLAPQATLIPMVADVKRAIVWMKTHAASLGINPARIVLMGGSAGAHLALLAAYTPNHPILDPADVASGDTAVHSVISYYGVSDAVTAHEHLTRLARLPARATPLIESVLKQTGLLMTDGRFVEAADMLPNLLGGQPDVALPMYELASPIIHVGPHCPPTLLINGTHDLALHIDQHRQLHAALFRAHVPCVHVELEYADHAFDLIAPRWSPGAQAALYDIERFLALMV